MQLDINGGPERIYKTRNRINNLNYDFKQPFTEREG